MAINANQSPMPMLPVALPAAPPTLVYSPHPLLAAAGRQCVYVRVLPGENLDAYLNRINLHLGNRPVICQLNGATIPRSAWKMTVLKPGDQIAIRAQVQGGGDEGSDPARVLL
ncbi:MAG: MoaD/ThiS family protein, partial [Gammaproteobacteria bacterium]|nr:MoaD/ThiS family protein [Gammaproteobacteria bacterium]